jgi:uncharacterized protein (DUF433 family)
MEHPLIDRTPGTPKSTACIKDKEVTVGYIVYLNKAYDNRSSVVGMLPKEIAEYTHLTYSEVSAALCYYQEYKAEINADIWEQAMLSEQLENEALSKKEQNNEPS